MKLHELLTEYKEANKRFFMRAGEHKFNCRCPDCIAFLADGLDANDDYDPYAPWQELRDEEASPETLAIFHIEMGPPHTLRATTDQIERLHRMASELL